MKSTFNQLRTKRKYPEWNVTNFEQHIFGTLIRKNQETDTLNVALKRYMSEREIGTNKLALLTGIPKASISRYCNGTAEMKRDHLYAVCIALRLRPCQQRHLMNLAEFRFPDERGHNRKRAYVIRSYLDGCFYSDQFTVARCNTVLSSIQLNPLTSLFLKTGDK